MGKEVVEDLKFSVKATVVIGLLCMLVGLGGAGIYHWWNLPEPVVTVVGIGMIPGELGNWERVTIDECVYARQKKDSSYRGIWYDSDGVRITYWSDTLESSYKRYRSAEIARLIEQAIETGDTND